MATLVSLLRNKKRLALNIVITCLKVLLIVVCLCLNTLDTALPCARTKTKSAGKKLINIWYVLFLLVLELVRWATKNNGSQLSARQGDRKKTRISNNKLKIAWYIFMMMMRTEPPPPSTTTTTCRKQKFYKNKYPKKIWQKGNQLGNSQWICI